MLTWEFPPQIVGGLSRHVYGLAKELVFFNWEIHVVTAKKNKESSYENVEGIHVWRVAPLNDGDNDFLQWVAGLNLAMAEKAFPCGKQSFFLVHAHDWLVGAAALCVKNFCKFRSLQRSMRPSTEEITEFIRNCNVLFTKRSGLWQIKATTSSFATS